MFIIRSHRSIKSMKNEHLFIAQVELKTISRHIFCIKYLILKTIKKITVAMLD
jgi:hypothetical protein